MFLPRWGEATDEPAREDARPTNEAGYLERVLLPAARAAVTLRSGANEPGPHHRGPRDRLLRHRHRDAPQTRSPGSGRRQHVTANAPFGVVERVTWLHGR